MPTDYKASRDRLSDALLLVPIDSPEWVKTRAAITALDEAEAAEALADFINASRRIDDAAAKLRAIVAGVQPNALPQFMAQVSGALDALAPVLQNMQALLAGEPATALPGMSEVNRPSFPTADAPVVPPVRELARDEAAERPPGAADVDQMIDDILRREGGFVDHPSDRGGATNFGVTLRSLADWRRADVSKDDVRNLTRDEARRIYRAKYFSRPKIDRLPALLQSIVFDMSINHGPGTAIKLLQEVLNDAGQRCDVDGGIGDETLGCAQAAVAALGADLVGRLVDRRIAFYRSIVAGDASQGVFLKGWTNRANEFRVA